LSVLIFLPTLNESLNAAIIVKRVNELYPDFEILVIDDDSVDGTVEQLRELKLDLLRIEIRRDVKGIGNAHKDAILFAKRFNFKFLITMDSDGTHDPIYISDILTGLKEFDLVIGSRFLERHSIIGWGVIRRLLTWGSHCATSLGLGIHFDCSSGYRGYRLASFRSEEINQIRASNYDFFFESLFTFARLQKRIGEVAIKLYPRNFGHSKMSLLLAISGVTRLFFRILRFRLSKLLPSKVTISRAD